MRDPETVTATLRNKMLHFVSQGDENPFQIPSSLSLLGFVSARFTCLPETSTPLRSAQDDTENEAVTHNPVGADIHGGPQNRTAFYHRSASLPLGGYLPPRRDRPPGLSEKRNAFLPPLVCVFARLSLRESSRGSG